MLASTQYIDAGWRMYASVNWVDIDSSNGLSPLRYQAISWTKYWLFFTELSGVNFSENLIKIRKCVNMSTLLPKEGTEVRDK